MNRRGFVGLLGAAPIAALPAMATALEDKGVYITSKCLNRECGKVLRQFVDLTQPLRAGNQCPRCLWVLDMSIDAEGVKLVDIIKKWNAR